MLRGMKKQRRAEDTLGIVARLLVTCFDFDWPGDLVQSFLRQRLETYCLKVESPSETFLYLSLYDYLRKVRYCRGTLGDSDVGVLAGFIYRRGDNTPSVRFGQRDFLRCRNVFFIETGVSFEKRGPRRIRGAAELIPPSYPGVLQFMVWKLDRGRRRTDEEVWRKQPAVRIAFRQADRTANAGNGRKRSDY